jgi:hypothetical protein
MYSCKVVHILNEYEEKGAEANKTPSPVFRISIWIRRIRLFLGLPNPSLPSLELTEIMGCKRIIPFE